MELFDRNKKTIKEIYDEFTSGKLIVDDSYQRRHVWLEQDNIRLIETILMGLIVPEVFFWQSSVDPDTGDTLTHIVDGQQRINAIVDFVEDRFILKSKCLLDDVVRTKYENCLFSQLPNEAKTAIWTYKLSIVDIDKSFSVDQIKSLFFRLNLTTYNLNSAEKRNSKDSVFGDKAESLSKADFWEELRVFSANDVRRMKDTAYCCSIYILAKDGVVDQTDDKKINEFYDDFSEEFDSDNQIENKIFSAMDIIRYWLSNDTFSFISKKAQMYTMFCTAFRMINDGINNSENIKNKITKFIVAYNLFKNEYEISFESHDERAELYDSIKRYKLASSEGVNKYQNRMIRYEQFYKNCIISDDSIINTFEILIEKLIEAKQNSNGDNESESWQLSLLDQDD